MGHTHDHAEEARIYYLDQLCTLGLCGALSGVGIMMWYQDLLKHILNKQFHPMVLAGSIAVLVFVVIRAVALWSAVGPAKTDPHSHGHDHEHHHEAGQPHVHGPDCAHDHDHQHHHDHEAGQPHVHGPDCAHDHDHQHHHDHEAGQPHVHGPDCAHDHDHGTPAQATALVMAPPDHGHDHDHGWSPWRYMMLMIPVAIFLCGLPNQGFVPHVNADQLSDADFTQMPILGNEVIALDFTELKQAAFLPGQREFYNGKMGTLLGQYMPGAAPTTCSLIRVKMVCCAADATSLNVVVISPTNLEGIKPLEWVEVTGQIQFRLRRGRDNEFIPILQIQRPDQVKPATPPSNPYL